MYAKRVISVKKGSFLYSYEPDNDPEPSVNLSPEQRAMCLGLHNLWPEDQPEFKAVMLKYQHELLKLARRMLRMFALGLGAEETYFDKYVTAPFASIILQTYYPIANGAKDPDSLHAHSDWEGACLIQFTQLSSYYCF